MEFLPLSPPSEPLTDARWTSYIFHAIEANYDSLLLQLLTAFPTYPLPNDILQRILCQRVIWGQVEMSRGVKRTLIEEAVGVLLARQKEQQGQSTTAHSTPSITTTTEDFINSLNARPSVGFDTIRSLLVTTILTNYPNTREIIQRSINNEGERFPHGLSFLDFAFERCASWGKAIYQFGGRFSPNYHVPFNHITRRDPIGVGLQEIYFAWATPTVTTWQYASRAGQPIYIEPFGVIDYENFDLMREHCRTIINTSPINWFWSDVQCEDKFDINSTINWNRSSTMSIWTECDECEAFPLKQLPDGSYKSPLGGSRIFPKTVLPNTTKKNDAIGIDANHNNHNTTDTNAAVYRDRRVVLGDDDDDETQTQQTKSDLQAKTYTLTTPLFLGLYQDLFARLSPLPIVSMQYLLGSNTRPNVNLKMTSCQHCPRINSEYSSSSTHLSDPPIDSITPLMLIVTFVPKVDRRRSEVVQTDPWKEQNSAPFMVDMIIDTYISSLIDGLVDSEQSLLELNTYTWFEKDQELVQH